MSYCQLIEINNGQPFHGTEYQNSYGGAARIWSSLFDKYLKNPAIPYHCWLSSGQELWDLAKNKNLPMFERAVHSFTFDRHYVSRKNFSRFTEDLKKFVETYPADGKVCHLLSWAAEISSMDCDGVGIYGTSVAENPWFVWDDEKEEDVGIPSNDKLEIYNWLESLV